MSNIYAVVTEPHVPLPKYIEEKIKLLTLGRSFGGFCIKLTETEIAHFHELKSEIAVDNYARQIFMDKL